MKIYNTHNLKKYFISPTSGIIFKKKNSKKSKCKKKENTLEIYTKKNFIISPCDGLIKKIQKNGKKISIVSNIGVEFIIYTKFKKNIINDFKFKKFITENSKVNTGEVLYIIPEKIFKNIPNPFIILIKIMNNKNFKKIKKHLGKTTAGHTKIIKFF